MIKSLWRESLLLTSGPGAAREKEARLSETGNGAGQLEGWVALVTAADS
jgi:hypothetical protein